MPTAPTASGSAPIRFPKTMLCGMCHNNETVQEADYRDHGEIVRHPQQNMLEGKEGGQVPGATYSNTFHTGFLASGKDGCLTCHMNTDAEGNHTFMPTIESCRVCHTGLADFNNLADLRWLHRPRLRAVHLQGLVTAPVVVMGEVVLEDPPQMPLAQNDDVVEAFATDAADHPLDVGRLPRTPRCGHHLLDAHRLDPTAEVGAVDPISVSEENPRRRVPRECLYDLLSRPPRRRVIGDVEVHDCAPVVSEDYQDEEHLEANRRDCEEVQRHQLLDVVGEERPPRR